MSAGSPKRRVLFVEDEPALRKSYERFFSSRYELAFAGTGAEGLRRLDEFKPDVLVLDLRLPDTDGIALLQTIRRSHADLPVVVTTAYMSMEPLIGVLKLEHSAYLVKPYDLNDLAARIDAAG
jgi:DNA-binding response OmpR family regulator